MWNILEQIRLNQHPSCIIEIQTLLNSIPYLKAWSSCWSFVQVLDSWGVLRTSVCLWVFRFRHLGMFFSSLYLGFLDISQNDSWYISLQLVLETIKQRISLADKRIHPKFSAPITIVLQSHYNRYEGIWLVPLTYWNSARTGFMFTSWKRHASASNSYEIHSTRRKVPVGRLLFSWDGCFPAVLLVTFFSSNTSPTPTPVWSWYLARSTSEKLAKRAWQVYESIEVRKMEHPLFNPWSIKRRSIRIHLMDCHTKLFFFVFCSTPDLKSHSFLGDIPTVFSKQHPGPKGQHSSPCGSSFSC